MRIYEKQSSLFRSAFTQSNAEKVFGEYITFHSAAGVDGINKKTFAREITLHCATIARKTGDSSYAFSRYKHKLLSRGADKPPRVVSIPTIRDKIVLKILNDLLLSIFNDRMPRSPIHQMIGKISESLTGAGFDYFIRIDVKDYYPSIRHDLLLRQISKVIKYEPIISLVSGSICDQSQKTRRAGGARIGVPQGLAISNLLANLYLINFDKYFSRLPGIAYFRYVDDILVLCKESDFERLSGLLRRRLRKLGLQQHPYEADGKSRHGRLSANEIDYLGYRFAKGVVTVRDSSIDKLRDSLTKIFTEYKYAKKKNQELLRWKVNLRVTGCVSDAKKYGWLFFFSQIDDLSLLHKLDHFIVVLSRRYGVPHIKFKSFSRSFHEIRLNLSHTRYIPDFDGFSFEQKKELLETVFDFRAVDDMTIEQIEYQFRRKIHRSIRELEQDLQRMS